MVPRWQVPGLWLPAARLRPMGRHYSHTSADRSADRGLPDGRPAGCGPGSRSAAAPRFVGSAGGLRSCLAASPADDAVLRRSHGGYTSGAARLRARAAGGTPWQAAPAPLPLWRPGAVRTGPAAAGCSSLRCLPPPVTPACAVPGCSDRGPGSAACLPPPAAPHPAVGQGAAPSARAGSDASGAGAPVQWLAPVSTD